MTAMILSIITLATLKPHYTPLEIIASIIIFTFMLVFFVIIPIDKTERNARNKRAFQKWREDHGLPYFDEMEEETEMDLWEVEYPCDRPADELPTKTELSYKTANNMKKFLKKYWVSITLFVSAFFAIIAIFIWFDYKDAFTAFVAVTIPTAILSIEMRKNKDQFCATIELDRINNIRSQGAKFLEALNDNEFVKLNHEFVTQTQKMFDLDQNNGELFNGNKLIEMVKPISDKLHIEWLKLEMLIPDDNDGKFLKDKLLDIKKTDEMVLGRFQSIVAEVQHEMLMGDYNYTNFSKFISKMEKVDFDLKRWVWKNDVDKKENNVLGSEKEYNEMDYTEPTIYYIGLYIKGLLAIPSRNTAPDGVEKTAMTLISNYCNLKEKELKGI